MRKNGLKVAFRLPPDVIVQLELYKKKWALNGREAMHRLITEGLTREGLWPPPEDPQPAAPAAERRPARPADTSAVKSADTATRADSARPPLLDLLKK